MFSVIVAVLTSSIVQIPTPPKEFYADHPFVYYLQKDGLILFVGKMTIRS